MFTTPIKPDYEALINCILRKGTPQRVHHIELFLDGEVQEAVAQRFDLLDGLDPADPYFAEQRQVRIQRFLGYDYVRAGVEGLEWPLARKETTDTAALERSGGRAYIDETTGPITNWEEFEAYPWPNPHKASTRSMEWYNRNLPDDMCIVASGGFAHFAEYITWLMGYETLCYALYDQRDLVEAIADRLLEFYIPILEMMLQFERVQIVWGSDDMGFRSGTLIGPDDLREFVLPGHKQMAQMSHAAGKPYLLHSCGNLATIMDDLIDDVQHRCQALLRGHHRGRAPGEVFLRGAYRPPRRHRRGLPLPRDRSRKSAPACVTRSTPACRAAATAWGRATASPTTSRSTTTWRWWTKGANSFDIRFNTICRVF